jgi:hypothetical protein
MTTDLILVDAVPALATLDLSAEMTQKLEDLLYDMTTPPPGLENSDWRWEPDVVKIKTPTTTDASCPSNAEVGDIWSAGEILWSREDDGNKKPWRFIPIFHWLSHSKFRQGEKRPDCSSPDGVISFKGLPCNECPHEPWRGSAKLKAGSDKTACAETHSFVVMNEEMTAFHIVSFRGSSIPGAKTILKNTRRPGLWGKVWALTSSSQTKGSNTWQKYEIAPISGVTISPEIAAFAKFVHGVRTASAKAKSEELKAKQAEMSALLDADVADTGATGALEAELEGDDGFSESM